MAPPLCSASRRNRELPASPLRSSLSPPLTCTLRTSLLEAGGCWRTCDPRRSAPLFFQQPRRKKRERPVGRGQRCSHTTYYFLFRWGQGGHRRPIVMSLPGYSHWSADFQTSCSFLSRFLCDVTTTVIRRSHHMTLGRGGVRSGSDSVSAVSLQMAAVGRSCELSMIARDQWRSFKPPH